MTGDPDSLAPLVAALRAYEFGEVLGRGAWGVVLAARHRHLHRDVAVKWLPSDLMRDPKARQRFAGEARLLAALDHPHIVRVHDYVETDEVCALVMERLHGGTLADRMRVGRTSKQVGCAIQLAALHGLEHAHQHAVLHRDIKPENLMFAHDGLLKVTDFGIATVLGPVAEKLTADGIALGTPAYMAPEQISDGVPVSPATDVWAAGAVFYELLSGDVPYPSGSTVQATLLARVRDEPRPLADVDASVPPAISDVVMKALQPAPDQRFERSVDFALALEEAATTEFGPGWLAATAIPVHRTAARAKAAATSAVSLVDAPPGGAPTRRFTRRRITLAAAAVVALGAAATGTAIALSGGSGAKPHGSKGSRTPNAARHIAVPAPPASLPAVPAGWPKRLEIAANLPSQFTNAAAKHYGSGVAINFGFGGDPTDKKDPWTGSYAPAADQVREMEHTTGATPFLFFYVLRDLGQGVGHDADFETEKKIATNKALMTTYWQKVSETLKSLGSMHQSLHLTVEQSVVGQTEGASANGTQAAHIPFDVAKTGNNDLQGLPNTFGGFFQAWVKLRDKYAPNVALGMGIDSFGFGDYLISTNSDARPSDDIVDAIAASFSGFYSAVGAKMDYLDYVTAYGEAGYQNHAQAPGKHTFDMRPADYRTLLRLVSDLVSGTSTRLVLDSVPLGNAQQRNVDYHWQDSFVQTLLGDTGYGWLYQFRNAGVIGLQFQTGDGTSGTCPCPADPAAGGTDDDGGYFAAQTKRYFAAGGMLLS